MLLVLKCDLSLLKTAASTRAARSTSSAWTTPTTSACTAVRRSRARTRSPSRSGTTTARHSRACVASSPPSSTRRRSCARRIRGSGGAPPSTPSQPRLRPAPSTITVSPHAQRCFTVGSVPKKMACTCLYDMYRCERHEAYTA